MSRVQATFASVSVGSSQTDGRTQVPAGLTVGDRGLGRAESRVTAPWKCSNRIPDIVDGIDPNRSMATSIRASDKPSVKLDSQ